MAEPAIVPPRHVSMLIYGLTGGGVPRRQLALARALANAGHRIDLLVMSRGGPLRSAVPPCVRLVDVGGWATDLPWVAARRRRQSAVTLPGLMRYLRRERPDMLLAAGHWANFTAICAHRWARSRARLVVSQRSHLSRRAEEHPRYLRLARRLYPRADLVIAVSGDVRDDLVAAAGVSPQRIAVVHNPVVDDDVERRAAEPLADSWLAPGEPPVVLGVGRLVAQKDFPTLIRAFAHVRARRTARLCILGDGPARASLATLARELGIADDVALPGFVPNPLPYMARAAVFVLSSAWEGLPGALIEAMACGCPVVSTRCPGGAAEILDGGRYGPLVPVGDDGALAEAIVTTLATRPDARALRLRASDFSKERAVARYMDVLFGASVGLSG